MTLLFPIRITQYLQLLFMLLCNGHYFLHILRKAQLSQRFIDVFRSDGLFRFALGDLVRFGGYQGDELDATFDEQVAGFFGECCAGADG
jgi:hypothetical protein